MTNPTVLQVIPALDAGGAEQATVDITRALTKAGMTALVASGGGRLEAALSEAGGELIRMGVGAKDPATMIENVFRLSHIIRGRNVSLIHARSRAPAWSAFFAARRTSIPFVTTYHGIYNAANPLKRFYNSIMARADAVIANSEWTADHIKKTYRFAPKRLVVIPRGIAVDRFDPEAVSPDRIIALRGRWQALHSSDKLVLMPGRLTRWKGQFVFVAALAHLRQTGRMPQGLRAVVVGDAQGRIEYLMDLEHAVEATGLEKRVLVDEHCEDMPAAYLAADLIVSASTDPEAFGRAIAEASAMRRPVIATDHGGTRETVIPAETGLLVPPGDPESLGAAIADVLARSDADRVAMGSAGRAHIAAHFTLERMCEATLALYRHLIG